MVNKLNAGDLRFAFAVLASGNNFKKIELFSKHLGLHIMSESSFHKIQRSILVPCIEQAWIKHQRTLVDSIRGQKLVLLGKVFFLINISIDLITVSI